MTLTPVCAAQLLPAGLSTQPTAVMDTQSYSFCRFGSGALPAEVDGCDAMRITPLVAVAGSDPAAVELWDADSGESCVAPTVITPGGTESSRAMWQQAPGS